MKLSVAVADYNAAPSAFVVWRGFEESIIKAKEYGYNGVELALRKADEIDALSLQRILERNNIEVSCISTGQVFASLNQYLTNKDTEARMQAVKTLSDLAVLAKDFGSMVNIGRARGFYTDGDKKEEVEGLFIDSLTRIAETADKHGVTVVIEPVNRYEINFINNLDECANLLTKAALKNVGIMPDVFHMNIEDAVIGQSFEKHGDLVKYIHLADSNRHAPGSGHMNFDEIFQSLLNIRYDGWVSVEILPVPDPDTAALSAVQYLLPRIDEYNKKMDMGR